MHVLEIVSAKQSNGVIAHFRLLAPALRERGHRVTVLARAGSPFVDEFTAAGFETLASDLHRWPADEIKRIAAWAKAEKVDVVHAHMSRANNFGLRIRQATGIPCVLTAHALTWHPHWRAASHVIAVSEATAAWHRRRNLVTAQRMSVVRNFVAWPRPEPAQGARAALRAEWGVPEGAFLLGAIGDVIPRKGQDLAVRALAQTPENVRLVVVGRGEGFLEKVRAEAARLGVADRIVWAGFRTDIPAVHAAIDGLVMASRRDPCPMAVIEALGAGLPVVGTRVDGIPEFVTDGATGFLAPADDAAALGSAMARLSALSPHERAAMGDRARSSIADGATVASQVPQIESILARETV